MWKCVRVRALRRCAERSNGGMQALRPLRIAYSVQSLHCCLIDWLDPLESVVRCYGEQSLGFSVYAQALGCTPLPTVDTIPSQAESVMKCKSNPS